jgi:hypothetical protein
VVHAFMHNRTIEHVREETVRIEDGVLRQEQLIWCIKRQQQRQHALRHAHFKLRAMFLYNMDLDADEMRDFAHSPSRSHFITPVSAVEDVAVRPTIPMFASLNALYIMYACNNEGPQFRDGTKRVVVIQPKKHGKHARTRRTAGD